jgi:hypothetical protein
LPRLPDTAEEVRDIAMVLHADVAKDVFLGAAANEKTVRTMDFAGRRIIVFATRSFPAVGIGRLLTVLAQLIRI